MTPTTGVQHMSDERLGRLPPLPCSVMAGYSGGQCNRR